ncbi:uncharacterized protein BO80DRAFT_423043 [Aspergillus ibericus CBS 121593]|uniref:Uncharacterized protein n=1 Tax=Aspergillus ibericus CBS 121593 TaxID=1448316 RepID=A0A395H7K5_9EURO|nr:hypothetical protein BO80DRAFT_423043 [Aspergillus ibericus CBS 121593]RAL03606.1 hypothetical protein BO80DRAFT_423043 [Aspergillus ibericus CBS 121593]
MSKSQHTTPCLISLTLTTLFLITIVILLRTPPDILPHILPPICPSQTHTPDSAQQTHGRIFTERPDLERITNDDSDAKSWESILLPPSGGGIRSHTIPDSINPNDVPDGKVLGWGISMFHQLHCLIALRALIFPETTENKINSTSGAHTDDMVHDRGHWAHCFDYIAQVGGFDTLGCGSETDYIMVGDYLCCG